MVHVQPEKVIIVSTGLYIAGGLEKMTVALANVLAERGYDTTLLILDSDQQSFFPIHSKVTVDNLEVDFGIGRKSTYLQRKIHFLKNLFAFRKKVIALQPDIVISTEYPQTAALIAGNLHKKHIIISWQHSSYFQAKSTLWKKLSDYAYKKVHAIVCLNEDERLIYSRLNTKTYVIPNFIEPSDQQSLLNNPIILTVAHLSSIKGIDLMLEAARHIISAQTGWKWKIIGNGPLKDELLKTLDEYLLQDCIEYLEPTTHLLNHEYVHASIYVLPSRKETFGMVLLEAMSHGLPCVAFDCDTGPRHIITHNVDGLLVEKENPEKLAEAILLLIEDKEKRSRMGKAAFENVKRFSSTVVLKKWEVLFKTLFPS